MSKNNLIEELTYYKNLTDLTVDCIVNNSGAIIYDKAKKIKMCGTFVETAQVTESDGTVRDVITAANFCRLRLCPMCQKRRSLKVYADVSRLVEYLGARGWCHMVLTLRNCSADCLDATITKLFKDSSFLMKSPEFKRAFHGALRCLEVTYNERDNTFHPHLHVLLSADKSYNNNARKRISRRQLRWLWWDVTGVDYLPQVYLDSKVDDGVVAEISKYCVKPLELELAPEKRCEVLETLYTSLHGRRLIQTYGEIRTAFQDLRIDINADPGPNYVADSEQMFVYDFATSSYFKRK